MKPVGRVGQLSNINCTASINIDRTLYLILIAFISVSEKFMHVSSICFSMVIMFELYSFAFLFNENMWFVFFRIHFISISDWISIVKRKESTAKCWCENWWLSCLIRKWVDERIAGIINRANCRNECLAD